MSKQIKKTIKKSVKKVAKASMDSELKADVYNIKGEKVGKLNLPKEIFGAKVNTPLLAQAVRVYLENQRQGTRKAKTRGEVSGSTRKLFRQKGTGRARAGSIKSPIQVGGGIIHGPRIKNFHLDFSKHMKKVALTSALTQKFQSDKIRFINSMENFAPKTKDMISFLKNMSMIDINKKTQSSTLLITDKTNNDLFLAGRNLQFFEITPVSQLNPYQVLKNNNLLFLKNSLDFFKPKLIKEESEKKAVK